MKTPREIILTRHRQAGSKLAALSGEQLAAITLQSLNNAPATRGARFSLGHMAAQFWMEAVIPWRRAWMIMGILWLGILALNFASGAGAPVVQMVRESKPDPQVRLALLEQRKLMAQLLETPAPSALIIPAHSGAKPRSDRRTEEAMA